MTDLAPPTPGRIGKLPEIVRYEDQNERPTIVILKT
jgi:hypothetical protein